MKLSTKIFLILSVVTLIPGIFLSRYIFEGITPTSKGFTFSFDTFAYVGIGFMVLNTIFTTICFVRFLRTLKLSKALFFSLLPITIFYGIGIYLISDLTILPSKTSVAVRAVLNISETNNYNSILWAVLLTLIYIFVLFMTFAFVCRPVQKIERITTRLGDGRMNEKNINIGKSKQFKRIENSLEKINYNYKEKENLLRQADIETQKFIPKQFLKFLGKSSIYDLELGNQVQKKATTLFCDLVNSSKVSSTFSLEENFNFINSYLNVISPIVRKYDGFVDKYFGDGILAVFPRAERAIECAHTIQRIIDAKNKSKKDTPKIEAIFSINSKDIIFGVVGEEDHKSITIISDVVNLASKMKNVNKYMGTKMIFSKQVLNDIPEKFDFLYRYIGTLRISEGQSISLFESLEIYPREKREKLVRLKTKFENGVRAFNDGLLKEAKEDFAEILKYVPDDKPSYMYFNRTMEKLSVEIN